MINKDSTKMPKMFIEATIPNSLSNLLSVMIKVAKPDAVVILVIKVAFPTFDMTRCKDRAWFPCFFTSCWYLFIRNIQLGIPITDPKSPHYTYDYNEHGNKGRPETSEKEKEYQRGYTKCG